MAFVKLTGWIWSTWRTDVNNSNESSLTSTPGWNGLAFVDRTLRCQHEIFTMNEKD